MMKLFFILIVGLILSINSVYCQQDTISFNQSDRKVVDTTSVSKFDNFTDIRDGKTYMTVKIKDQIWMATNLSYIPDSGKYWAWENNKKNVRKYGYLYNWETAKIVCPVGWHLPSKVEFEILLQNTGGKDSILSYKTLKSSGNSGFSLKEIGLHHTFGFSSEGGTALWSDTEKNKIKSWILYSNNPTTSINFAYKNCGLFVRCIKDK